MVQYTSGVAPVTSTFATTRLRTVRDTLAGTTPRTKTAVRAGAVIALVGLAYHYSLISLLQSLDLQTPLAYVGLAPIFAIVVALLRARTTPPDAVNIVDRQVDYIVGVPLLVLALAINMIFPSRLSTLFWVWRIDLFSLPFFVAGAVCTVFGVRTMWRHRLAIAFLFLAWPVPYSVFLSRFLQRFTNLTLSGLKAAVHVLPLARAVPSTDGSLFEITHHAQKFTISVVSACSGVNGMVGFLLVGAAFGAIVGGPRLRKALWLLTGMVLLWFTNIFRIMVIFLVGHLYGENMSIKVFHPFIGLLTFNLGVIGMVLLLKPFRLYINGALWDPRPRQGDIDDSPGTSGAPASGAPGRPGVAPFPRVGAALVLVALLGLTLSVLDSGFKSYDLVADAVGNARLASFSEYPATPDGWRAQLTDQFDWAKPYFGQSSTWLRYTLFPGVPGATFLQSTQAITADVISASNVRVFSAYGVDACYRFHGYKLRDIASVKLGGGVQAQALSYYNTQQKVDWSIIYWIWPVNTGTSTRYERVTLYIQSSGITSIDTAKVAGIHSDLGGLSPASAADRKLVNTRAFLVAFARQIVQRQATILVGTRLPASGSNTDPSPAGRLGHFVRTGHGTQFVVDAVPVAPSNDNSPTPAGLAQIKRTPKSTLGGLVESIASLHGPLHGVAPRS
jgi:exosortase